MNYPNTLLVTYSSLFLLQSGRHLFTFWLASFRNTACFYIRWGLLTHSSCSCNASKHYITVNISIIISDLLIQTVVIFRSTIRHLLLFQLFCLQILFNSKKFQILSLNSPFSLNFVTGMKLFYARILIHTRLNKTMYLCLSHTLPTFSAHKCLLFRTKKFHISLLNPP